VGDHAARAASGVEDVRVFAMAELIDEVLDHRAVEASLEARVRQHYGSGGSNRVVRRCGLVPQPVAHNIERSRALSQGSLRDTRGTSRWQFLSGAPAARLMVMNFSLERVDRGNSTHNSRGELPV
jgi:hypothetical protein